MKLLIQLDDYGVTEGVAYGAATAFQTGVPTCAGLFVNSPAAPLAVRLARSYPAINLGIDINLVQGKPATDPVLIPHLVDEAGQFRKVKKAYEPSRLEELKDELKQEMLIETRAQLRKFQLLVKSKPEYIHEHNLGSVPQGYKDVLREVAAEEGIPFSMDFYESHGMHKMSATLKQSLHGKPYTAEWQAAQSTLEFFKEHGDELLSFDMAYMNYHAGFVDAELMRVSSYNIMRAKDLELITSEYLRDWIRQNHVDLVGYRDLLVAEPID